MYQKHFAKYIAAGIDADEIESLYEKVHEAIRANPEHVPAPKFTAIDKSFKKAGKKSHAQRKADAAAKKAALKAADEDEEED